MAQIDKFIEKLHQHEGDRLVLAAGEPITLHIGDTGYPLTSSPVSASQIDYLLQEVQPNGEKANGDRSPFLYAAPSGGVSVESDSNESRAGFILRRSDVDSSDGSNDDRSGESEAAAEAVTTESTEHSWMEDFDATLSATEPEVEAVSTVSTGAASDTLQIDDLLRRTVEEGCSDLHLSAGNPPMFRKDGSMVALDGYSPLNAERTRELLFSIAPAKNRAQFEKSWDTDFAYEIPGLARFRANLFMDRLGAGGVFRVIPAQVMTADQLGLSKHIRDLCQLTKGLVLVTGPTGSGKSTTLAAMIDHVNKTRAEHIITIEDPIEFVHSNNQCLINQREVGVHTQGFKVALRAALREDPDIVMVGEMRDLETVEIALETAETGHLVFGTLHTTTAAATVDRIIDQFPADQQNQIRTMLANTLKGVIAQTLCTKKGGGRVAAMEVLLVSPAVSNLIREGKTYQIPSAIQTGRAAGMQSLTSALVELVGAGTIDAEEAYRKAVDKGEIESALSRAGFPTG